MTYHVLVRNRFRSFFPFSNKLFYVVYLILNNYHIEVVTINSLFADLHIHTIYSADSLVQPKTIVDMLIDHNFIKVAAITDHNSVRGCKMAKQLASAYPDILIIPGVEISTQYGDIVILGTEELPPLPWSPEAIVEYARSIGGVSIVAHPFRLYGMGERARDYKVDAIEIMNGGSSADANNQAKELARSLGLPGTAGSDAHSASELFSVCTRVEASLDIDSVLNAIRKGYVSAQKALGSIHI